MKDELMKLAGLVRLTHRFQQIRRTNLAADGDRENDAEHSYQLALVAWYLNHLLKLGFDIGKLVSYALMHDLAEVYAGDVDPYYSSQAEINAKEKKEREAIRTLESGFPELAGTIRQYEDRKDKESKFVYALDKLLVFLNIYILSDPYYTILESKNVVSMQHDMKRQIAKTDASPKIKAIFCDLMSIVSAHKTGELRM